MAFVIRQSPVGALSQLAIKAGQGRAQQIKIQRDTQLLSQMLGMRERGAARAADRAERKELFAMQQAGARRVARRQPAEPAVVNQRAEARKMIEAAEVAGIYDPRQIKQARVFAESGNLSAVSGIFGTLPKLERPSTRERESQRQLKALEEIRGKTMTPIQERLTEIQKAIGEKFTPESQPFLRENPELVPADIRALMTEEADLRIRAGELQRQFDEKSRLATLGIPVAEQIKMDLENAADMEKARLKEQEKALTAVGKLTADDRVRIDLVRDEFDGKRKRITNEIRRLEKDLAPLNDDEADDVDEYNERTGPIRKQITALENRRTASYATEMTKVGGMLDSKMKSIDKAQREQVIPAFQIDSFGKKWWFTGEFDETGGAIYDDSHFMSKEARDERGKSEQRGVKLEKTFEDNRREIARLQKQIAEERAKKKTASAKKAKEQAERKKRRELHFPRRRRLGALRLDKAAREKFIREGPD